MDKINFKKTNVLPVKPIKNTLYFIENGDYAELYLTSNTGVYKKVGNTVMITEVITSTDIPPGSVGLVELSPIVNNYLTQGITAYSWGDHSTFGYLTSFTETDPIFTAWDRSTGISILASQVSDFDTEVSNNPSVAANTIKVSFPGFTSLLADYGFADNSVNWDTAFGWGDHSTFGYLTSLVGGNHSDLTLDDGTNPHGTTAADIGVEAGADVTDADNIGSSINSTTAKTTPVDADLFSILDSAASFVLKKVSWANIKATLKTYFDGLYNNYIHPNHSGEVTSTGDGATIIANDVVDRDNISETLKGYVDIGAGITVDATLKTRYIKTCTAATNLTITNPVLDKTITIQVTGVHPFTITNLDPNDYIDYDGSKWNFFQIYCYDDSATGKFIVSHITRDI